MALPTRPIWTGQIRLALVALPVKLYAALDQREKISFNQIHEKSGQRVRYQKIAPGVGPIEADEITRGYEYEKGRYITVSDEELDALKVESKRTLDLQQFVSNGEIDPMFFDKPYYAMPDGKLADEPFRVVRDALRRSKTCGLGQITMRGRSYLAAVRPHEDGIVVETMHYGHELRKAAAFFDEIPTGKVEADLVDLAEELIQRKKSKFDPEKFKDEYAEALERLVKKKIARGNAIVLEDQEEPAERGSNVVNLVDALRQSLERRSRDKGDSEPKSSTRLRAAASRSAPAPRAKKAPAKRAKSKK